MRGSGTRARARRHILGGHLGTVFDASFSPDGRWVVTAGPTKAGLWDATTGEFLYFLQGQRGPLRRGGLRLAGRGSSRAGPTVSGPTSATRAAVDALLRQAETRLRETGGG